MNTGFTGAMHKLALEIPGHARNDELRAFDIFLDWIPAPVQARGRLCAGKTTIDIQLDSGSRPE
ncbi:hypothetical protein CCB80_07700 [Armatimonadetes bacterium Uphvl-Ar1]|nr:hypothetical protein CCB80_07700 [Armatimonadetes bacterium Uphvl-Ar1]